MRQMIAFLFLAVFFFSCYSGKAENTAPVFSPPANIPPVLIDRLGAEKNQFVSELNALIASDGDNLLVLADKTHPLPALFVPPLLVPLVSGRSYTIGRDGLSLRKAAADSLEKMAAAARKDGITLLASSSYRSYAYQKTVYERNVLELGKEKADRESARPGTSQHQLGTAVDFGSITDAFARTASGVWLSLNAGRFGWSLSFPDGYEKVTGYRWECWHYRYIGVEGASFQKKWFADIQQYMLEYIDAWKKFDTSRQTAGTVSE